MKTKSTCQNHTAKVLNNHKTPYIFKLGTDQNVLFKISLKCQHILWSHLHYPPLPLYYKATTKLSHYYSPPLAHTTSGPSISILGIKVKHMGIS